jgi:hypothetical protein
VEWYRTVDNCHVHHNWIEGCNGVFESGGQAADHQLNNRFDHNVCLNNGNFCVLHLTDACGVGSADFLVENNTIVEIESQPEVTWETIWFDSPPDASRLALRNNIIYAGNTNGVARYGTFDHTSNIYYLAGGQVLGFDLDASEQFADPLFVDLAGNDFHLRPGSPATGLGAL